MECKYVNFVWEKIIHKVNDWEFFFPILVEATVVPRYNHLS